MNFNSKNIYPNVLNFLVVRLMYPDIMSKKSQLIQSNTSTFFGDLKIQNIQKDVR